MWIKTDSFMLAGDIGYAVERLDLSTGAADMRLERTEPAVTPCVRVYGKFQVVRISDVAGKRDLVKAVTE